MNIKEPVIKPSDEWKRVENTHEAIIKKTDFDLMQKILQLDTRTPSKNDKVHAFSGVLICGSCGARMMRKAVPYKGIKYDYCWCPTTKKRRCHDPALLAEKKLMEFVLESIKSHISNVTSIERATSNLGADGMASRLRKRLSSQVNENKRRLEKIRDYEASLDEKLFNGSLTRAEYESINEIYTKDSDLLIADNERLQREVNGSLSYINEQTPWIEHFKGFAGINALDHRTVINLIQYIKIKGKADVEIVFHYQSEYEAALALLGPLISPENIYWNGVNKIDAKKPEA